jgi:hypothetical protein
MPAIIQIIAQRLVIFLFGILAFFGINPDISIPNEEALAERKDVQRAIVQEILTPALQPPPTSNSSLPTNQTQNTSIETAQKRLSEVEQKITDIQRGITQTVSTPITSTAQNIIPQTIIQAPESVEFNIKSAVVHIICLEKTRSYTRMSSGSGVIVARSGIILTNAHVAYPFLFSEQFNSNTYSCSIRSENIPNTGYKAELVYFPIDWLLENKEIIKDPSPIGTGENDYAFLRITTPIGPTPRILSFSHAQTSITDSDLQKNLPITVAGYPNSNSGVFEIDTSPGLQIALSSIIDFFTFGSRTYDILQTDTNSVASRGSSGGGIFIDSNLYGVIVTTNTNSRGSYINALTVPYIKRDLEKDTGISFDDFINSPHEILRLRFNTTYKDRLKTIISSN